MRYFICFMRPSGLPRESENYESIFKKHGGYLQELSEKHIVHFAGYTDGAMPGELSLAVLSARDLAEAVEIMQRAPAVEEKLLTAQLEPFEVFVSNAVQ